MSIPLFFAMTKQELSANSTLPEKVAWMSCHFSAGGVGLADVPDNLPPKSMLILNDRLAYRNHDAELITAQIQDLVHRFQCSHVLLDFERSATVPVQNMVKLLVEQLPCPVGVPPDYARGLDCPVFLPPIPPQLLAEEVLAPFQNREIWLEVALDGTAGIVTEAGCSFTAVPYSELRVPNHQSQELRCHYHIDIQQEHIQFSFYRTPEDILPLLDKVEPLGVTLAVGLYQELFQP